MTKALPKPNVQVRSNRTGTPRLTSAERQQLASVTDPTLKKIMGEVFIASRANQDNFDEITQWFPIQPADAAYAVKDQIVFRLELLEGFREKAEVGEEQGFIEFLDEGGVPNPNFEHIEKVRIALNDLEERGVGLLLEYMASLGAGAHRGLCMMVGQESGAFCVFELTSATSGGFGSLFREATVVPIVAGPESPDFIYGEQVAFFPLGAVQGEKGAEGAQGAEGRWASLAYEYLTNTEEKEPSAGGIKFDAGKTLMMIRETDKDGGGVGAYLATWDDSTTTGTRGFVILRKVGTPATFAVYKVTGALTDKGTWDTLPVELIASNGAFANTDRVSVEFYRTGDKGEKGEAGAKGEKGEAGAKGEKGETGAEGRAAGLKYTYSTNTEETDPTAGKLKFNKAVAEATSLRISETDGDGNAIAAYLATLDDSTNAVRGHLLLRKVGAPAVFAIFSVTGALVDKGTWDTLVVTHIASNGLANNDVVSVEFIRAGDQGEKGEKGEKGAAGEKGEKGEKGETGEAGESANKITIVESGLSAAGTGTLEVLSSVVDKNGLLVLIVADDATPSDEVTEVTVGGVKMFELPGSPFLHTAGSEDGVIYAYFLARPGISGNVKATVSGATTKRMAAIGIRSHGALPVACDTKKVDSAGTKKAETEELGGIARENLIIGALHSGADAVGTVTVPADEEILQQHDFGTTTASWIAFKASKYGRDNLIAEQSIEEEAGLFAVAISTQQDFGVVTALPTEGMGRGDVCHFIADATNGVIWDLIYDGEGEFPWKKIGGPPLYASSDVARNLNKEAYTSLPTDPLKVTAPLKGDYDIEIQGTINNKVDSKTGLLSYAIGATAASDNWAITDLTVGGVALISLALMTRQLGVAAGATIEEKGRGNGEIEFNKRRLIVDPVRVG